MFLKKECLLSIFRFLLIFAFINDFLIILGLSFPLVAFIIFLLIFFLRRNILLLFNRCCSSFIGFSISFLETSLRKDISFSFFNINSSLVRRLIIIFISSFSSSFIYFCSLTLILISLGYCLCFKVLDWISHFSIVGLLLCPWE